MSKLKTLKHHDVVYKSKGVLDKNQYPPFKIKKLSYLKYN